MKDFLHIRLEGDAILGFGTLAYAHIGDAVYSLLVRLKLCDDGATTAKGLHKRTITAVSAAEQAVVAERIIPLLSEEESEIFRRGRNAKVAGVPKRVTPETYHMATALETLFGYLYLSGRYERINELFTASSDLV